MALRFTKKINFELLTITQSNAFEYEIKLIMCVVCFP